MPTKVLRQGRIQKQVRTPNTIYIIESDIDLKGSNIYMPDNCVLSFKNGSLSGGTIVGKETVITAASVSIFKDDLKLSGTWVVDQAYAEWFGARINDNSIDSREAIQKCLDVFNRVKLLGLYYFNTSRDDYCGLVIPSGALIEGVKCPYPENPGAGFVIQSGSILKALVLSKGVILRNFSIKGSNTGTDRDNHIIGISATGTSRVHLSDIQISNCGTAFDGSTYLSLFDRVTAFYCVKGFHFYGTENSQYTSISLNNCSVFSVVDYAYKFEKIIYSSLNTCAADYIGYDSAHKLVAETDSYEGSYSFVNCVGISVISCGAECSLRALSAMSCGYMTFDACRWTCPYEQQNNNYLSKYLFIQNCFDSSFKISCELFGMPQDFHYVYYSHYSSNSGNSLTSTVKKRITLRSTGRESVDAINRSLKYE